MSKRFPAVCNNQDMLLVVNVARLRPPAAMTHLDEMFVFRDQERNRVLPPWIFLIVIARHFCCHVRVDQPKKPRGVRGPTKRSIRLLCTCSSVRSSTYLVSFFELFDFDHTRPHDIPRDAQCYEVIAFTPRDGRLPSSRLSWA